MDRRELKRLSKNELIRLVLDLSSRVEVLDRERARLRKDSSTSSKPPSSDIVKPPAAGPPKRRGRSRDIGAQPGHEKHEREPYGPDEVDEVIEYAVDDCPDCGGHLRGAGRPGRVLQQVELVERPLWIREHRAQVRWCPHCRVHVEAALPAGIERGGLFGPRLSAFVAYVKGGCHASYTTVQSLLGDALGVRVSTGFLAKVVNKAGQSLTAPYDELGAALRNQPWLNVDESGHKDNGNGQWVWCFRAPDYTWFRIDASRGSQVLRDVLGAAFSGVLGSDYFSAYLKYAADCDVRMQFCLAHLIRDVRFLMTLPDKTTSAYGQRVLDAIRTLFKVIHAKDTMTPAGFRRALERAKRKINVMARRAPDRSEARNIAARFKANAAAYFEFIKTPGVEPTNNLAEQAIRFVVIDRKVTQGTRGKNGRAWCERIWTTMATCAQRGESAFNFLVQAMHAHFTGRAPPSLVTS